MSYSSLRRALFDESLPLPHRASRARSYAMLISFKFRVKRSVVIERILADCGVDLHRPRDVDELRRAYDALERLRLGSGFGPAQP